MGFASRESKRHGAAAQNARRRCGHSADRAMTRIEVRIESLAMLTVAAVVLSSCASQLASSHTHTHTHR